MNRARSTPLRSVALLLTLAGLATPALAQNALGDGTALDAGLQASGGRVNTRVKDVGAQIRAQNRQFEGQAGRGRSFQGSVGSRATNEFRGTLGSDSLFEFRRDAASGGVATLGIRSSDALRYQFAHTSGQNVPPQIAGLVTEVRGGPIGTGAGVASLRSTAQFQSETGRLPSILGYTESNGERAAVTASPLRGIASTPVSAPTLQISPDNALGSRQSPSYLTGFEPTPFGVDSPIQSSSGPGPLAGARAIDERAEPGVSTFGTVINDFRAAIDQRFNPPTPPADTVPAEPGSDRSRPGGVQPGRPGDATAPPDPLNRPSDPIIPPSLMPGNIDGAAPTPGAPTPSGRGPWVDELDRLRSQLGGGGGTRENDRGPASRDPRDGREGREGNGRGAGDTETTPRPGLRVDPNDPAVAALQKMRTRVDGFLASRVENPTLYAARMGEAQTQLEGGRYFDAEATFSGALVAKPGDVMAGVGRVHAQLGAGLYLSAAGNLRDLFVEHPEVIPTRYGVTLLPTRERAETIVAQLRADAAKERSALGDDGPLLLAYLGRQFEQADWTKEGLVAMGTRLEERKAPPEDRNLLDLLWAVWGEAGR